LKACWFLLVLNFPGLFITVSQEEEIIRILKAEKTDTEVEAGSNGVRVIPGTRRIEDNLSDLRAQVSLHFCPHSHQITFFSEFISEWGREIVPT
jgi:5-oxoprolinase (ATP-hydrolysing)